MKYKKPAIVTAAAVAAIGLVVAWSEFHSDINRFLGLDDFESTPVFVAIFIAAVLLVFLVAGVVAAVATRNCQGGLARIVRANLLFASIVLSPTLSWIVFGSDAVVYYVIYAGMVFWPLILAVAIAVNTVVAVRLKTKARPGDENRPATESAPAAVDVAEPDRPQGRRTLASRAKTWLSMAIRLLFLYLVVGAGITGVYQPAGAMAAGDGLRAVFLTGLYLLVFVPVLVMVFLPLKRIVQAHIAIRAWAGLVACLLLLGPIYSFVTLHAARATNADTRISDYGTLCFVLTEIPASGAAPKIDIAPAGKAFFRYNYVPRKAGKQLCAKQSVSALNPLAVRVYSANEANRDNIVPDSMDRAVERHSMDVPLDGKLCIYVSPSSPAGGMDTDWTLSTETYDDFNLVVKFWRALTDNWDLCPSQAGSSP